MLLLVRALPPVLKKVSIVMLGGSLGAASRYSIRLMAAKTWGTQFPWGTLRVNMIGCFLIGLIFALADRVRLLTPDMRLLLITGFLGALTTLSSFFAGNRQRRSCRADASAFGAHLVNNLGGLALTFVGLWVGSFK